MNTIHIYEFPPELIRLAAAHAEEYIENNFTRGHRHIIGGQIIYCWRTKTGNVSVRLIS